MRAAPLSRHLTRFSAMTPAGVPTASPVPAAGTAAAAEPVLTMTIADLNARLAEAREERRAECEALHAAHSERAAADHADALAKAVAAAAARRDAEEGAAIAAQIAAAMADLRGSLCDQIAATLRPLLTEAVVARAMADLVETVERVLADPDHPALTIRAPAPLLAVVEAALQGDRARFEIADGDEVSVVANGIRIETRLLAAQDAIAASESL